MIYGVSWKDKVKQYAEKRKIHTVGNIVYFSKISCEDSNIGKLVVCLNKKAFQMEVHFTIVIEYDDVLVLI